MKSGFNLCRNNILQNVLPDAKHATRGHHPTPHFILFTATSTRELRNQRAEAATRTINCTGGIMADGSDAKEINTPLYPSIVDHEHKNVY